MSNTLTCTNLTQVTIPAGADGADGAAGSNGTNGTNGSDGLFGGFSGEWVFDTATSANPPVTELRFNNATLSSVTAIYVNDTNADSTDYNGFLETFKNTISGTDEYGLVRVWKQYDSNTFLLGKITNVVDNGADHTITITYIGSNGTFTDTDDVVMSFAPSGASSIDDPEVLFANHTQGTSTSAVMGSLMSETIAAGELAANGDSIDIQFHADRTGTAKPVCTIRVLIGGTNVTVGSLDWNLFVGADALIGNITITRVSATVVFLELKSWLVNSANQLVASYANNNAAFPFIAAKTNLVDIQGASANVANTVRANQLLIKKFDI